MQIADAPNTITRGPEGAPGCPPRVDGRRIIDHLDGRKLPWLAEKAALPYIRVYRIATKKTEPSANDMLAIAGALGKTIYDFTAQQEEQQA